MWASDLNFLLSYWLGWLHWLTAQHTLGAIACPSNWVEFSFEVHSDEERRFMYRIDQGCLTVFCIVFVWLGGPPSPVRIIAQVPWFMYQNRVQPPYISGPKLALLYHCVRSTCAQLLAYAEWKRARPFSAVTARIKTKSSLSWLSILSMPRSQSIFFGMCSEKSMKSDFVLLEIIYWLNN